MKKVLMNYGGIVLLYLTIFIGIVLITKVSNFNYNNYNNTTSFNQ